MAEPLRVDSALHTPLATNIPSINSKPTDRKPNMRLWDPDSAPREWNQDEPQDWWFASTAIPLLAATIGPLANVLSVAALVTPWRSCLIIDVQAGLAAKACAWNGQGITLGTQLKGQPFDDPVWAYSLNILSLATGLIGNVFFLFNFTKRIRYIIALPVTIVMWSASTAILIAITVAMHNYTPPVRPQETYHQGFWYAIYAAIMYLICTMILLVNMLGHVLGHYPQTFALSDSHRTLILQTTLFFVWLAAGGAVFSAIESRYGGGSFIWSFANSLYFCEVTILTVGFGDIYPTNNFSRGLMLPYAVGGIVMLGLVVSSLTTFATDLGATNIVKKHAQQTRNKTIARTVTNSTEYLDRQLASPGGRPHISGPTNPVDISAATRISAGKANADKNEGKRSPSDPPISNITRVASGLMGKNRKPKLLLLREEKDRFDTMRHIQKKTANFKKWSTLGFSVIAFGLMWCLGALVFWLCERRVQDMTYFQALYFCWVCLLTIGYGDMAPQSNAGRPFFVVWSLIALPTMAFLVKFLGDTVIGSFKRGVSAIGDFTLLPKKGVYRKLLDHFPRLTKWLQQRKEDKASQKRLEAGFPVGTDEEADVRARTLEQFARETPTHYDLARRLAKTIHQVAKDAKNNRDKQYTYVEWLQFAQMIKFTAEKDEDTGNGTDEDGVVEWDWIGDNSPMMAHGTEADFVLDRLCESMNRYIRRISNTENVRESHAEAGRAILASGRSKPLPMPVVRASSGGSVRKRGSSVRGDARRHHKKMAMSNAHEQDVV